MSDEETRELQEELSRLKALVTTAGWKYLEKIAAAQVEHRRNSYELRPLSSLDETLAQEYQKGEVSGIRLFVQLPSLRISALEEELMTEGESDE